MFMIFREFKFSFRRALNKVQRQIIYHEDSHDVNLSCQKRRFLPIRTLVVIRNARPQRRMSSKEVRFTARLDKFYWESWAKSFASEFKFHLQIYIRRVIPRRCEEGWMDGWNAFIDVDQLSLISPLTPPSEDETLLCTRSWWLLHIQYLTLW